MKCKFTGKVRQEKLDFLATNSIYTKDFAFSVGKRCQESTISKIAEELNLDWKTVKSFEMEYMQEKLNRMPRTAPEIIGIDEISIHKRHKYKIIVSDLKARRPIWVGGKDRKEESLDEFFQTLSEEEQKGIRLCVMDMWKAFENSTRKNVPQASILYDKFHVMRHLGKTLDQVRKDEYKRVSQGDKKYIKGKKYTLLSRFENLEKKGKESLKELFEVNKRIYKAYLLKESFGQLWSYRSEGWARKFFETWKSSLQGQKLMPFERFASMIERHWDGIKAYCQKENKVALGYVEGLNNKIRVIQRRCYGIRDEEYFALKVLTCTLPEIDP